MNGDREATALDGSTLTLHGRFLLVHNVGHLMTNPAILMNGEETPEGIMDGMVTVLAAMHDLKKINAEQQPYRFRVHREAEDTTRKKWRLPSCLVVLRRRWACRQDPENRHHG